VDLVCPACGLMRVLVSDVEVHVNRSQDFALYAFTCPTCAELVVRGCRETIHGLLAAGAARRELRSTSLPPLTVDDLLDFHLWLASDPPLIPDEPEPALTAWSAGGPGHPSVTGRTAWKNGGWSPVAWCRTVRWLSGAGCCG
jgi:hypothetical protein